MQEVNTRWWEQFQAERRRTYSRIYRGELPRTMEALTEAERLAVLVEEVGEIAQAVKVASGLKPRKKWSEKDRVTIITDELVQVGAIVTDWLQTLHG